MSATWTDSLGIVVVKDKLVVVGAVVVDNTVVLVSCIMQFVHMVGGVVVVGTTVVVVVAMRSSGLTEKDIRKAPGQLPNSADVIPFLFEPFRKRWIF